MIELVIPDKAIYQGNCMGPAVDKIIGYLNRQKICPKNIRFASDCRGVSTFSTRDLNRLYHGESQGRDYSQSPYLVNDSTALLINHLIQQGLRGNPALLGITNGPIGDAKGPLGEVAKQLGMKFEELPVAIIFEGGTGLWRDGGYHSLFYDPSKLRKGAKNVVKLIEGYRKSNPALQGFEVESAANKGEDGFDLTVGLYHPPKDKKKIGDVESFLKGKINEISKAYGVNARVFSKAANGRVYITPADASKIGALEKVLEPKNGIYRPGAGIIYTADAMEGPDASKEEQAVVCSPRTTAGFSIRLDKDPTINVLEARVMGGGKKTGERLIVSVSDSVTASLTQKLLIEVLSPN